MADDVGIGELRLENRRKIPCFVRISYFVWHLDPPLMALLKIRTISKLRAASPKQPDGNTMKLFSGNCSLFVKSILVIFAVIPVFTILGQIKAGIPVQGPAADSAPGAHCLIGFLLYPLFL
jgi:hypothetical protein